jgi:hypothetical protein
MVSGYGQEYSWGVSKMDLFSPLFPSLPEVDNLKCILHKWRILVCDAGCSIPTVQAVHLDPWVTSSVNYGDTDDYYPN